MNPTPKRRLKRSVRVFLYTSAITAVSAALYAVLFTSAYKAGQPKQLAFARAAQQVASDQAVSSQQKTADAWAGSDPVLPEADDALPDSSSHAASDEPASSSEDSAPEDSRKPDDPTIPSLASSASDQASDSQSEQSSVENESAKVESSDHGFAIHPAGSQTARTILIDAGHGGSDLGDGAADGTLEKTAALDFAKAVRDHLKKQNPDLNIVMTREDDSRLADNTWNDTSARLDLQNNSDADYVISLHAHSSSDAAQKGYQMILNEDDPIAIDLAGRIVRNLESVSYLPGRGLTYTRDYPLQMIAMSNAHAIELDFASLSSSEDLKLLHDPEAMDKAAAAVAAAISDTIIENPDAPDYTSKQKLNDLEYQNV